MAKEEDGFLGNWRMVAFKRFPSRERIRAKADVVMKSCKVGMETAEAGPEVYNLKSGTSVKMIFILIVLLLNVFNSICKINVLYFSSQCLHNIREILTCFIMNFHFKNVTRNKDTLPKANWFRESSVCRLVVIAFSSL